MKNHNIEFHRVTWLVCIQLVFKGLHIPTKSTNHNGVQRVNVALLLAHPNHFEYLKTTRKWGRYGPLKFGVLSWKWKLNVEIMFQKFLNFCKVQKLWWCLKKTISFPFGASNALCIVENGGEMKEIRAFEIVGGPKLEMKNLHSNNVLTVPKFQGHPWITIMSQD